MVSIPNSAVVPSSDVVDVVVSPSFSFLQLLVKSKLCSELHDDFHVAARDCWYQPQKGVLYTGEISAEMLVNWDIPWIIIGHTEGRVLLGQTNEFIGDKVAYALSKGLKVIACVSVTLQQRWAGVTIDVVAAQAKAIADKISNWSNVVIAYEPLWAIGSNKDIRSAQAEEMHAALRNLLTEIISPEVAESTRILCGGYVSGGNCKELAAQPDIDGFLVGGGYLKPEFIDIIKAATLKTP